MVVRDRVYDLLGAMEDGYSEKRAEGLRMDGSTYGSAPISRAQAICVSNEGESRIPLLFLLTSRFYRDRARLFSMPDVLSL